METITRKTMATTITIHDFYCDECGIHFGTSREHDDGYYQELGGVDLKFYTPNGWYRTNKCLCDTCRSKYISDVCTTLESIGFSIDTDD